MHSQLDRPTRQNDPLSNLKVKFDILLTFLQTCGLRQPLSPPQPLPSHFVELGKGWKGRGSDEQLDSLKRISLLSTPPSHSNDPGISGKSSVIRKNCRKPVFNGNMAICITLYLAKVWLFLESKYFIMRLLAFRKSFLLEKTKLICIWVSQAKFWIYPIDFSSIFRFNSCCFNSNILLLSVFSF